jgi:hypothetical protein
MVQQQDYQVCILRCKVNELFVNKSKAARLFVWLRRICTRPDCIVIVSPKQLSVKARFADCGFCRLRRQEGKQAGICFDICGESC